MSSGCLVSDSNTSIFCCTPSSNTWKASTGRAGLVVVIENADEHVNEIDADADAAALIGLVVRIAIAIIFISGLRGRSVFGSGVGTRACWGAFRFGFSRPGRAIRAVL